MPSITPELAAVLAALDDAQCYEVLNPMMPDTFARIRSVLATWPVERVIEEHRAAKSPEVPAPVFSAFERAIRHVARTLPVN